MLLELSYSLVIGVVAGVVATFLVFTLRAIWERIIMPWYEERLYQGAEIEGVWLSEITFPSGEINKHRMRLRRQGYNITGRSICFEGYSEGNAYDMHGTFKNLTLSCTYRIDDPRRLEQGAMVAMMLDDGKAMKGVVAFYDDKTNSILSANCEWTEEKTVPDRKSADKNDDESSRRMGSQETTNP